MWQGLSVAEIQDVLAKGGSKCSDAFDHLVLSATSQESCGWSPSTTKARQCCARNARLGPFFGPAFPVISTHVWSFFKPNAGICWPSFAQEAKQAGGQAFQPPTTDNGQSEVVTCGGLKTQFIFQYLFQNLPKVCEHWSKVPDSGLRHCPCQSTVPVHFFVSLCSVACQLLLDTRLPS